jgi:phosphoadenosine phosphosulfate reductase
MSLDFVQLSHSLEGQSVEATLRDAANRFPGRLTFATGLGIEDCVLIDVIGRNKLNVDLFTLDTGVLFPETYELWRRLQERYGVTIRAVRGAQTLEQQAQTHGAALWTREPDKCCDLRKVQPLRAELAKFDAWITGIRRDQTPDRANAQIVEPDKKFSLVKVSPLVAWTNKDVWSYVARNNVPYNPLHDHGYPSVGCQPCTSSVKAGEDPRAGRWRGTSKNECGLHSDEAAAQEKKLTVLETLS